MDTNRNITLQARLVSIPPRGIQVTNLSRGQGVGWGWGKAVIGVASWRISGRSSKIQWHVKEFTGNV